MEGPTLTPPPISILPPWYYSPFSTIILSYPTTLPPQPWNPSLSSHHASLTIPLFPSIISISPYPHSPIYSFFWYTSSILSIGLFPLPNPIFPGSWPISSSSQSFRQIQGKNSNKWDRCKFHKILQLWNFSINIY